MHRACEKALVLVRVYSLPIQLVPLTERPPLKQVAGVACCRRVQPAMNVQALRHPRPCDKSLELYVILFLFRLRFKLKASPYAVQWRRLAWCDM